jgi:hypothetical protein
LGIRAVSLLRLKHLGKKSKHINAKISKHNTEAIDMPTILLLFELLFFAVPEFDSCVVDDGPFACLPGVWFVEFCLPPGGEGNIKNGGAGDDEGDPDGSDGAGGVVGVGGDTGEILELELNRFPSVLRVGMPNNLSGIGPEKRLFSTFKSLTGESCNTSSVPES